MNWASAGLLSTAASRRPVQFDFCTTWAANCSSFAGVCASGCSSGHHFSAISWRAPVLGKWRRGFPVVALDVVVATTA
jgi:hypothetical protein